MDILTMLKQALELGASDIFIIAGLPLTYKINGRQQRVGDRLMPEDTRRIVEGIYAISERPTARLDKLDQDDDFSFAIPQLGRFRANVLHQRGTLAMVLRVIRFGLPWASLPRCCRLPPSSKAWCWSPVLRAAANLPPWPA